MKAETSKVVRENNKNLKVKVFLKIDNGTDKTLLPIKESDYIILRQVFRNKLEIESK